MSARQDRSNAAFSLAQRAHEEPPEDDGTDWLEDKPLGFCPWCSSKLFMLHGNCSGHLDCWKGCGNWAWEQNESQNRARYAREREEAWEEEARNGIPD